MDNPQARATLPYTQLVDTGDDGSIGAQIPVILAQVDEGGQHARKQQALESASDPLNAEQEPQTPQC